MAAVLQRVSPQPASWRYRNRVHRGARRDNGPRLCFTGRSFSSCPWQEPHNSHDLPILDQIVQDIDTQTGRQKTGKQAKGIYCRLGYCSSDVIDTHDVLGTYNNGACLAIRDSSSRRLGRIKLNCLRGFPYQPDLYHVSYRRGRRCPGGHVTASRLAYPPRHELSFIA